MDRNIITPADVGRMPHDEYDDGVRVPPVTTEAILRWGATFAFLGFAGGFMYVLGVQVGAWLAMFAGVVLMGGPMVALWVHRFRVQGEDADRAEGRRGAGAFHGAAADEQHHGLRGGTSLTVGPGRDDDLGGYGEPRSVPPWRDEGADGN